MRAWIATGVLVGGLCLAAGPNAETFDYDVAIRGGRLYLGGFEMGPIGDVAVNGDEIVAVGDAPGQARIEIDAAGLIVAPGFIDLHTHSDLPFQLISAASLSSVLVSNRNYITQGVTTVVTGNCGSGFTGVSEIEKWFKLIDKKPFGTNVIHLFPHGELRLAVMGENQAGRADPAPTPEELEQMKAHLEAGLATGAWGMSTGLEYDPGARADTSELIELARVVAQYGGVYASHTRHEGPDPEQTIASYQEALEIGERAGVSVQISHIKCSGKPVHGLSARVIAEVEAARARGVRVFADQYPYPAGSTTLSYLVPVEYRDGTKVIGRYCTRDGREEIYDDVARVLETEIPPEAAMVSLFPWKPWLQNKTVAEIAERGGKDPVEVAMDLACSPIGTGIYFTQNEEDVQAFMKRDWVATGSDGSAFHHALKYAHPRFYGTFPKKIRRYVYEEEVITLPFALRSMTELPAESFQMPRRGKLAPGYYADVVAFDPDTIADLATFEQPCQYSQGIVHLMVNGTLTIHKGKITGKRAGRALRLGD